MYLKVQQIIIFKYPSMRPTKQFRSRNLAPSIHSNQVPQTIVASKLYKQSQQYFQLACKCMKESNVQKALNYYTKSIQLNPLNHKALCNLGLAYKKQKLFKEARQAFQKGLQVKPTDVLTYYNLGNLQKYLGNYEQAKKAYQMAVSSGSINEKNTGQTQKSSSNKSSLRLNCLINLGVVYKSLQQLNKAIEINENIIQQFPNVEQGYFNKGMCLMQMIGDKNIRSFGRTRNQLCLSAIQLFQKSLSLNPQNLRAKLSIIECTYLTNKNMECYKNSILQLQALKIMKVSEYELSLINSKIKYCKRFIQILENQYQNNQLQTQSSFVKSKLSHDDRLDDINYKGLEGKQSHSRAYSQASLSNSLFEQDDIESPIKRIGGAQIQQNEASIDDLISSQEYLQALKLLEKTQQSFQREQKIIVIKFLLALQNDSEQIYSKSLKGYNQLVGKANFNTIKAKISLIGHEVFAYMMKMSQNYEQSVKHYKFLVEHLLKQNYTQIQKQLQMQDLLDYCLSQLTECYIEHQSQYQDSTQKQQKFESQQQNLKSTPITQAVTYFKQLNQGNKSKKVAKYLSMVLLEIEKQQQVYSLLKAAHQQQKGKMPADQLVLLALGSKNNVDQLLYSKLALQALKKQINNGYANHNKFTQNYITKLIMNLIQYVQRRRSGSHDSELFEQIVGLLYQTFNQIPSQKPSENQDADSKNYNNSSARKYKRKSNLNNELVNRCIGDYNYKQQNYKKALEFYQKIVVCRDSVVGKIAICLIMLKKYQQAQGCFQYGKQLFSKNKIYSVQYDIFKWIRDFNNSNNTIKELFSCDCLKQDNHRMKYGTWLLKRLQQYDSTMSQAQSGQDTVQIQTVLYKLKQLKQRRTCCSFLNKLLTVMTLNYSGVLTSPYEYYQLQNYKQCIMSQAFVTEVSRKYPQFGSNGTKFTWDMGSLDTKWKQRFTPFNQVKAGIKENGMMMSQKQFMQKWQEQAQKTKADIKKSYFQVKYKGDQVQQRMNIQIERCREFDLFCYRTFIKVIYGKDISQASGLDGKKYQQQRTKDFSKPFLNQGLKQQKTLSSLKQLVHDVIYLQEANKSLIQSLKNTNQYYLTTEQHADSVILINKSSKLLNKNPHSEAELSKNNSQFIQKYSKIVNLPCEEAKKSILFNNDSVFQVIDKFLFFNVHLTSGKQKNQKQMVLVKKFINTVIKKMPQYYLIFGGDFNQIFKNTADHQNPQKLHVNYYPDNQSINTVKKKRTMVQPQRRKAEKLDESPKDYIISNLKISQSRCSQIDGKDATAHLPLLPNKNHPYDHFLVTAVFDLSQKQ